MNEEKINDKIFYQRIQLMFFGFCCSSKFSISQVAKQEKGGPIETDGEGR